MKKSTQSICTQCPKMMMRMLAVIGGILSGSPGYSGESMLPGAQSEEGVQWEGGQAAYINWWSQLFGLKVEEQGAFGVSSGEGGEELSFVVSHEAPENPSHGVTMPAFFMGTLLTVHSTEYRVPVFEGMEALVGGLPDVHPEVDGPGEGLFQVLMTPEEWGKLKTGDLPYSFPTAELNMLFVTRALPGNQPYWIKALQNLEGREVFMGLMWLPGEASAKLEVSGLALAPMDPPASPAERLIDRIRPEAIDGLAEAGSTPEKLEVILTHFSKRFVEPRSTTDLRPNSPQYEIVNLMLEDMWRIRWAGEDDDHHRPLPVDWRLNPIADPEWVWHLHWYRNFTQLVTAFRQTGYEGYSRKWREITLDWIDQNPPGTPHAWRSLDTAIRRGPLTGQIERMFNQPGITPTDQVRFLNTIADHGDYLSDPIKYHPSGNWGTAENNNLAALAERYPEFLNSAIWRALSENRDQGFQGKSVHADGSTREMTVGYHMHTISGLRNAYVRMADKETDEAKELLETLENMYKYVLVLTKPDGDLPQLGHSGRTSALAYLRAGAELTGRTDFRFVGTKGDQGEPPSFLDGFLADSPHYVMRTNWTDDPMGLYLMIKATTRGRTGRDGFNLDFYAYGKTLLLDGGAYAYHDTWAEYFAATRNHSTVTVGGQNHSHGPDAKVATFHQSEDYSYFDGEMEIYPGVHHRRRVLLMRTDPAYVIVLDDVVGEMEGDVVSTFLLSPSVADLKLDTDAQSVISVTPEEADLLIRKFRNPEAVVALRDGWQSYHYGQKNPRQGVTIEVPTLPARFGTLLFPIREGVDDAPRLEIEWEEASEVLRVKHGRGEDRLILTEGNLLEIRRRPLEPELIEE